MSPPLARITFAAVRVIGIHAFDTLSPVKTRRAVLTIFVNVGAIHFYTRHFERLDPLPVVITVAGVISSLSPCLRCAVHRPLLAARGNSIPD